MIITEPNALCKAGCALHRRKEDLLISGQTNWTGNISVPGLLHIAFLRSLMAPHGQGCST
jgi:carbon-monoxide dehydrogenase large subunit